MSDDQPDSVVHLASNDHPGPSDRKTEAMTREVVAAATNAVKRKNRGNLRKRPAEDSDEDQANKTAPAIARPTKQSKDTGASLAFTTKRDDKAEAFKFESSGTVPVRDDGGATRALETETQFDRDNRAIRERALLQQQEIKHKTIADKTGADDEGNVYRGMTGYKDYRAGFRRENTVSGQKATGTHGPLRASTHVRMSILVDYQPDVCKDYKETGYCGFGDSCKFLHDRGDYKQGWELDREWEAKQKEQRERMLAALDGNGSGDEGTQNDLDGDDDDELPFACFICRRPWAECQDPVVTKCKHYFCEQCALQHNAKSKKCFVCEQPTGGIFNVANDIIKKEKERKRKQQNSL